MRLQFVLSEMAIGLRRNLSMTVSVVLVTMVSLVFFGFGLLSSMQVKAMQDFWYGKVEVWIALCPSRSAEPSCAAGEVTQAQKNELATQLESLKPLVKTVYFESKQEAYDHFVEQFKALGDPGQRQARPDAGELSASSSRTRRSTTSSPARSRELPASRR